MVTFNPSLNNDYRPATIRFGLSSEEYHNLQVGDKLTYHGAQLKADDPARALTVQSVRKTGHITRIVFTRNDGTELCTSSYACDAQPLPHREDYRLARE